MNKSYLFVILSMFLTVIYFYQNATYQGESMKLFSKSFAHNQPLDIKYTLYGQNISPHLGWDNLPAGTKSLVLIVDDPDAPTQKPWVHAVGYNIDPLQKELKENSWGQVTGATDFTGKTGYQGPQPPKGHGVHRYYFKLFALDAELDLQPGRNKSEVELAMKGHILGSAEIIGTFEAP